MGGMDGFGRVPIETDEPAFHAPWEGRVLAMQLRTRGKWYHLDEFRNAIERIPAARYLDAGYYERWLIAIETLMVEKGVVSPGELATGLAMTPAATPPQRPPHHRPPGRPSVRGSTPEAASWRGTCIPRATHGCRGTCEAGAAWCDRSTDLTCSPIPTSRAAAATGSRSTRLSSRPSSSGGRTPTT